MRLRILRAAATLALLLAGPAASPAAPAIAGLEDGAGAAVDFAAPDGGLSLVYFGYTHCPEICPTSLFEMTAALALLPPADRGKVAPVFVTLDPARDTGPVMTAYVAPLDAGIRTVTGTLEAIDRLAWHYGIVVVRNLADGPNYTLDHTSSVLLLGPNGAVLERFPYEMDYREVSRRIAGHLAAPVPAAAPRS